MYFLKSFSLITWRVWSCFPGPSSELKRYIMNRFSKLIPLLHYLLAYFTVLMHCKKAIELLDVPSRNALLMWKKLNSTVELFFS